ncbi:MAG: guanylate kinase [Candidatus Colwellbacteria bacterium]
MSKGKLLVISGPSAGVGKDTIVRMFLEKHPDWYRPASLTTRTPRPGETAGVDYFFIDRLEFEDKIKKDELLEWSEVTGNLYGTLRKPVQDLLDSGKNILLLKEYVGTLAIKRHLPQTITVFLVPDNEKALEQRIRARATDTQEIIQQRLQLAKKELSHKDKLDFVIVNPTGHPEEALEAVEKAVGLLA